MPEIVSVVPVSPADLVFSKTNPRKHIDPVKLKELAASIKENGVIVPPIVRVVGHKFEVVAGERRVRAAREAKLTTMPVIVRELTDEQALEVQVIENLQREDIHPLEEAAGFQQLLDNGKHTPKSIAEKVGKTTAWVYQTLKLNELIPELKKMYAADRFNRTVALRLARISADSQKEIYTDEMRRYGSKMVITLQHIERDIERKMVPLDAAPFKMDAEKLHPTAPTCKMCPKRTGFIPELFPDVKKRELCLDAGCFAEKVRQHVARKAAELEEDGTPHCFINLAWYHANYTAKPTKDAVVHQRDEYTEVKKEGKGSIKGLVVEADDVRRMGQVINVTVEKKKTTKESLATSNRPDKNELFRRKVEKEGSARVEAAIMEKASSLATLPHRALALAVQNLVGTHWMSQMQRDHYQRCLSMDGKVDGKKLASIIHSTKTKDHDLHKMLIASLLLKERQSDIAEILKVDAGAIRRLTKAELEAARKQKESAQPAKAPKSVNAVGMAKKRGKKSLALPEDDHENDE